MEAWGALVRRRREENTMGLNLFGFLMPRQEHFVPLFCAHWTTVCHAADALVRLVGAPASTAVEVAAIRKLETEADQVARTTYVAANRTFNAPIDREDILALVHALDDVIDGIEDAAKTLERDTPGPFPEQVPAMVAAIRQACGVISEALPLLDTSSRNAERILGLCEQVGQIEGRVDEQFDAGLTKLHAALRAEQLDVRRYLDGKEVLEQLEAVVDLCDDVANAIQTITVKHV